MLPMCKIVEAFIKQIFLERLLYASHHSSAWDAFVNKTAEIYCFHGVFSLVWLVIVTLIGFC